MRKTVRIWDHGMWCHFLHPEGCTCRWCRSTDEQLITIGKKGNEMNEEVVKEVLPEDPKTFAKLLSDPIEDKTETNEEVKKDEKVAL